MLNQLKEFRDKLSNVMVKALHSRVIIYGYESYSGRFLQWYAKYYHGIEVDYLIDTEMPRGCGHTATIYTPELLQIDYKDVKNTVIWVAIPMTLSIKELLEKNGYEKDVSYYDFYELIFGGDCYRVENEDDPFKARKVGKKDVQFMEWLEDKYGCNFVRRVPKDLMEAVGKHGGGYAVTTQREVFPILDACHCLPKAEDAIFDFGCGKGAALVSFLDYGFDYVGGVEFEPKIYSVLVDNFKKLDIDTTQSELIYGDASTLTKELDKYNWFYFFRPFDEVIFEPVIQHICESYERKKRRIRLLVINPDCWKMIESTGIFRCVIQPTIDTRRRVVNIYETY